jgi:hypothetical protein
MVVIEFAVLILLFNCPGGRLIEAAALPDKPFETTLWKTAVSGEPPPGLPSRSAITILWKWLVMLFHHCRMLWRTPLGSAFALKATSSDHHGQLAPFSAWPAIWLPPALGMLSRLPAFSASGCLVFRLFYGTQRRALSQDPGWPKLVLSGESRKTAEGRTLRQKY